MLATNRHHKADVLFGGKSEILGAFKSYRRSQQAANQSSSGSRRGNYTNPARKQSSHQNKIDGCHLRRIKRVFVFLLLIGMTLANDSILRATPIVPSGLQPGDTYHLIFATSTRHLSDFGGIAAGDLIVDTRANAPGALTRGATYQAILSDSNTDAISLQTSFLAGGASPIYNTAGQLVANDYASMFAGPSTLTMKPILTEFGNTATFSSWTGTSSTGVHTTSFNNWTSLTGAGTVGAPQITGNAGWIDGGADTHGNFERRIYGISQQLTVIPEPTTVGLALVAMLFQGFGVLRGRLR